jgi:hypothetical protein
MQNSRRETYGVRANAFMTPNVNTAFPLTVNNCTQEWRRTRRAVFGLLRERECVHMIVNAARKIAHATV